MLIITMLLSCKKEDDEGFVTLTIKKGNRKMEDRLKNLEFSRNGHLKFIWKFTESCKFTPVDLENDLIKMRGKSDIDFDHLKNSYRFAYQPDTSGKNDFIIYAYTYVDGKFRYHPLGSVNVGESPEYECYKTETHYVFKFKGKEYMVERAKNIKKEPMTRGKTYETFWYFQVGTSPDNEEGYPAPHTMTALYKEI